MELTISQYRKRRERGFMTKGDFRIFISSLERETPLKLTCLSPVSDILVRGKTNLSALHVEQGAKWEMSTKIKHNACSLKVTRKRVCASFARASTSHPCCARARAGGFYWYELAWIQTLINLTKLQQSNKFRKRQVSNKPSGEFNPRQFRRGDLSLFTPSMFKFKFIVFLSVLAKGNGEKDW